MKENFDYITMKNYRADMAELTDQAIGIINAQKHEIERTRSIILMLLKAAGGSIKISRDVRANFDLQAVNLTIEYVPYDMSVVMSVR